MKLGIAPAIGLGAFVLAGALYALGTITAPIRGRRADPRPPARPEMSSEQAIGFLRLMAERGATRWERREFGRLINTAGPTCPKEELLVAAATHRHPEIMAWLISAGALPGGGTYATAPLTASAAAGDAVGVRILLEAGAAPDPEVPMGELRLYPTPLIAAVCSGSLDCADALVAAGADPDRPIRVNGFTLDAARRTPVVRTSSTEAGRPRNTTARTLASLVPNTSMALIVGRKRAPQRTAERVALAQP